MICLVSDSQVAVKSVHNIRKGHPPHSYIERRIKEALRSQIRDVGILWVRGHIGIPGNEKGDNREEYESILGELTRTPTIATEEGMNASSRAIRKRYRQQEGYNLRMYEWGRQELSTYSYTRTERGLQKKWLYQIRKSDSKACECGHEEESGHHLVFHCPRFNAIRSNIVGEKATWEALDKPDWRKVGKGEDEWYFEAREEFFGDLYRAMTGRIQADGN